MYNGNPRWSRSTFQNIGDGYGTSLKIPLTIEQNRTRSRESSQNRWLWICSDSDRSTLNPYSHRLNDRWNREGNSSMTANLNGLANFGSTWTKPIKPTLIRRNRIPYCQRLTSQLPVRINWRMTLGTIGNSFQCYCPIQDTWTMKQRLMIFVIPYRHSTPS